VRDADGYRIELIEQPSAARQGWPARTRSDGRVDDRAPGFSRSRALQGFYLLFAIALPEVSRRRRDFARRTS